MKTQTAPRSPFRRITRAAIVLLLLSVAAVGIYIADYWNLLPKRYYAAEHFGIETARSPIDFNNNGVDDYTDILLGARQDAQNRPRYDGAYQPGGYPPDSIGVCTDVVWRAFKQAGYSLKDMVDQDIAENTHLYPRASTPEPNIDFRRVPNLKIFFERYAVSLTLDPHQIAEWQPGDIVTFGTKHIGIISDRRNAEGIPYLIHNTGQPMREEDALTRGTTPISGHFRFDASRIDRSCLVEFRTP